MKVLIKVASIKDLKELMNWRMKVLESVFGLKNSNEYQLLFRQNKDYYQKFIPKGEHIAVFAEIDGKKVGCGGICFFKEMPSPDNPTGSCAYLMNIYTLENYRNKGIASKVVNWLVNQAKEKGIKKIYLETTNKARNLYENLGFINLNNYMILEGQNERDNKF